MHRERTGRLRAQEPFLTDAQADALVLGSLRGLVEAWPYLV